MEEIKNINEFRIKNYEQWVNNTDFWINNQLRHVDDTKEFVEKKIKNLLMPGMRVVDLGCGDGWLIDIIRGFNYDVYYKGIDFNENFVKYLKVKYEHNQMIDIELCDVETDYLLNMGMFDVVFNFFNFFEVADLNAVLTRTSKILNKSGKVVILTIEYIYLLLAISRDMKDFKEKLKEYEKIKANNGVPFFFQNIDMDDKESQRYKYVSVLYSFHDYFESATSNSMSLVDYAEVVKTSKYLPKVYQYMVFEKK